MPSRFMPDFRHCHDGIQACVHLDIDGMSIWLDPRQGHHKGSVLATGLFSIVYRVVLTVAFDRSSIVQRVTDDFISIATRGGRSTDTR